MVHNAIIAAIKPAITVIIIPIGFAFIAAFIAHCAIVAPSFANLNAFIAFTIPVIIETTFHANNPVAIPTIVDNIVDELSTINPTNSPILVTMSLNISFISGPFS